MSGKPKDGTGFKDEHLAGKGAIHMEPSSVGTETSLSSSHATEEVQTGNACIVCWRSPTDRAHLIDRSLCADPYSDPRRVVYLCREHHDAYDDHQLDLLPYLDRHRSELARAVECVGLITTLERVTGTSWAPASEETAIRRDIERVSGSDATHLSREDISAMARAAAPDA